MTIKNKTTNIYTEWKPLIEALSNEEAGILLKDILKYQSGEEVKNNNPVWLFIKSKIDDYNKTGETIAKSRSLAGKIGMAKRWGITKITNDNTDNKCYQMITNDNKNNNKIKENKIKENNIKEKKKKRVVPDDWYPKENTILSLKRKWSDLDINKIVEYFKNNCIAKGIEYCDFDRAILNWDYSKEQSLKRERMFNGRN
jgi:hypothetical protein